jgi:hypothetical protein
MKGNGIFLAPILVLVWVWSCNETAFTPTQAPHGFQSFEDSIYLPFGSILHQASYGIDISSALDDTYHWKMRMSKTGPSPEFKNWRLDLVTNIGTGPVAEQCQHSLEKQDSIVTIKTSCTIEPERDLDSRIQIDFDDLLTYEIFIIADFANDSMIYAEMSFPLQETKAIITDQLKVLRPPALDYLLITIKTDQRSNEIVTEDGRLFKLELEYSERFDL